MNFFIIPLLWEHEKTKLYFAWFFKGFIYKNTLFTADGLVVRRMWLLPISQLQPVHPARSRLLRGAGFDLLDAKVNSHASQHGDDKIDDHVADERASLYLSEKIGEMLGRTEPEQQCQVGENHPTSQHRIVRTTHRFPPEGTSDCFRVTSLYKKIISNYKLVSIAEFMLFYTYIYDLSIIFRGTNAYDSAYAVP